MTSVARVVGMRVAGGVIVLWVSVSIMFVVFHILPGNGVDAVLSGDRIASTQLRSQTEHSLGLDQSLWAQYVNYWDDVVHGDLGKSFTTDRSVGSTLAQSAPASLRLAFWALVIEIVGCLAVTSLVHARRRLRLMTTSVTVFAIAVPAFVLAYVLQLALGVYPYQHDWPTWLRFPVQGIGADSWFGLMPTGSEWRSLVLPAVTLATVSSAVAYRLLMSTIRTVQQENYVVGARARGLSERAIFRRHVLRNALLPFITFVGADLVALFGSAVLTETIFNWPGIGSTISLAMSRRDVPVVLGAAIVLAGAYVVANAFVDIIHRLIDPRVREAVS